MSKSWKRLSKLKETDSRKGSEVLNGPLRTAAAEQTHLGGQGAASGLSCHHICYTRWSRAARTHPPAPTLKRWSTPPCSRQTVASPPRDVSRAAKRCSGALGLRTNSGDGARKQGGDRAGLTERRHPTGQKKINKWERESWQLFQSSCCESDAKSITMLWRSTYDETWCQQNQWGATFKAAQYLSPVKVISNHLLQTSLHLRLHIIFQFVLVFIHWDVTLCKRWNQLDRRKCNKMEKKHNKSNIVNTTKWDLVQADSWAC